ncbi:MAG: hypothetical protein E6Q88_08765, partial [Lysobacteraceae bacterium]
MPNRHHRPARALLALTLAATLLAGCAHRTGAVTDKTANNTADNAVAPAYAGDYIGTTEPLAADAVYFVVTDRFVNGDTGNDQRDQGRAKGAAYFTFDRPTPGAEAEQDN